MLAFRPYGLQLLGCLHRPPRLLVVGLRSNARLTQCRGPLHAQARNFSFSCVHRSDTPNQTTNTPPLSSQPQAPGIYNGPLTATFRRLKVFSLASFGLSVTLAPFMFLVESNLPLSARFALASIATGTSGLSTFLVAWCAKPYVTSLNRMISDDKSELLEMTTMTLTLRPLVTRVYDPCFLIETKRPMAKWELADSIVVSPNKQESALPGLEETVAETRDKNGTIIGRWVVKWGENGQGTCHQVGRVVRYFNVHEELLR